MVLARDSNVGMLIDLKAVPIHTDTRTFASQANIDPYDLALYGGEDYELLACLREDVWMVWQKSNPDNASAFKQIGTVNDTKDIQLMFGNEGTRQLDLQRIFQHIS